MSNSEPQKTNNEIPIFCINLDRAVDRRNHIQQQWIDKLGLKIIFWKAYDRRDIEKNKHIYEYDIDKTKKNIGRELSFGEIACATSFISLYEHILSSDINEVLIMEDDIFPLFNNKEELFSTLKQGKQEYPNAKMMLLHEYPNFSTTKCEENKSLFSMCKKVPWGNQFFYANKHGIQNLYALMLPIQFPADWPQRRLANNNEVIMINKSLCFHRWSGPLATTYIGNNLRKSGRIFIE